MNNQFLQVSNKFRKNLIPAGELFEAGKKCTLAEVSEVNEFIYNAEKRLKKYLDARPKLKYPVKKYISYYMYSDVLAYEVIRQVSPTVVEVRALDTKQIVFPKEFHIGGFSAHCSDNYNQAYEYTSNEKAPIVRIHLSSKGWGKGKWGMNDKPYKHYDYNF
jgi:hypothetical protein